MTVRQIAEITGKSADTILRKVKKLFPSKEIRQGVPIDLSEFESYLILKEFSANFRLLPNYAELHTQNAELLIQNETVQFQSERLVEAASKLIQQLRLAKKIEYIPPVMERILGIKIEKDKYDRLGEWIANQKREKDRLKIEQEKEQGKLFN